MNNKPKYNAKIVTFTEWIANHPFKSFFGMLGVIILTVMAMGMLRPIQQDFTYRAWFDDSDRLIQIFDDFERQFGNDDSIVLAVYDEKGIFNKKTIELVQKLTDEMWQVPEVIRVDSLANYNWVHATGDEINVEPLIPNDGEITQEVLTERFKVATNDETVPDYLLGKDHDVALIFGRIKPSFQGSPDYELITKELLERVKKYGEDYKLGFYYTGNVYLSDKFREAALGDMAKIVPLVFLLVIFFLGFTYWRVSGRFRAWGILISLAVVIFTILFVNGFMGLVGIPLNTMTAITPQILIAICVADSVHLLVTFYQFYNKDLNKREAILLAMQKNFQPTLLTSISTSIGFMSFATAKVIPIQDLGFTIGFGAIAAWLVTYFIAMPLLLWLPCKKSTKVVSSKEGLLEAYPLATKITNILYRYRVGIVSFSVVLTLVAIFLASQNEVNSDPYKYFKSSNPLRQALDFLQTKVGGTRGVEIDIDSGEVEGVKDPTFLKKVEAYQDWVLSQSYVTKTVSILDILKAMNRALNGGEQAFYKIPEDRALVGQEVFLYSMSLPQGMDLNDRMNVDNSRMRITVLWTIDDSVTVIETCAFFEEKAKEFGLNVNVTGKSLLWQALNPYIVETFFTSMTLAIIFISILLGFAFKSISLGALALLPNLMPLLLGAAIINLLGYYIDVGVVTVFSICLGIAVDDTIHFVTQYNYYRKNGLSSKDAVAGILSYTAPALASTTMILVIAFSSFLLATFVPNVRFGVLTAIILSMAFIADFTFLPSLVMLKKDKEKK